jgi:protein SCO1/2
MKSILHHCRGLPGDRWLTALPVILALGSTACQRAAPPPATPGPAATPELRTVKDYDLAGEVRAIKKESGQVVIHHREIPGFMPAMTMPFTIKDRELFDDLRAGDEVEGTLRVVSEGGVVKDYELTALVVTKPALRPLPSVTLRLRDGQPELGVTPRRLEPGDAVLSFTMTTEDGRSLALDELRGKVVVLTFIYTRCPLPEFCPLMDRKFAALAAALEAVPERASGVRLISLSFDPEHDTPEVLRKHAQTQGAHPPLWTFAVARHDELAKVAPGLGLTYGPTATEIVHNLSTAVIGPDGRLAALFVGTEAKTWTPTDLLRVIAPLLKPEGKYGP